MIFDWLFKKKENIGVLESIRLTFGGDGNQVMTISGYEYATWVDHKDWPKIGDRILFTVYFREGKFGKMRCANLCENLDKKESSERGLGVTGPG